MLYHLPEVVAAVRDGVVVFVVEGEKDAEAVVALCLVATTNPGGAGKWRTAYSKVLRRARVVVIPDRDAADEAHAAGVADR